MLALPFTGDRSRSYLGYYPARFLRIYPPIWAAFLLSLGLLALFPREFPADASIWLTMQRPVQTAASLQTDRLLYGPVLGAAWLTNPVVWSMQFEVLFSLFLPLYVLAARSFRKLNWLKAVILLGAVVAFCTALASARYLLPMFGLGTLMAVERERLSSWGDRIRRLRRPGLVWAALTIVALVMMNSLWSILSLTVDQRILSKVVAPSFGLIVAGACLLLFLVIEGPSGWLARQPFQWLGSRSFSLYLIHVPVIFAAAIALGGTPSLPAILVVALTACLVVAEVFHRLVERPTQRFGRWVGHQVESKVQRRRLPKPQVRPAES